MRYITTKNLTIEQWKSNDPAVTTELIKEYSHLLIKNKLSPYDYHPVLGWDYENDDYVKNRITLILEAVKIITPDEKIQSANYKDNLK